MRRAILAITGTVAGLVALLSFKSHVPSIPSAAASGTGSGTGAAAPAGPPSSSSSGQGQGQAFGFTTGAQTNLPPGERAITGKVANTAYGPVQVQLVVRGTKIVKVSVLQQPTNTVNDIQIGRMAFPRLISETLTAQSAKIDAVSGASYTSQGYIQSLQSAVDRGVLFRTSWCAAPEIPPYSSRGSGLVRRGSRALGAASPGHPPGPRATAVTPATHDSAAGK
jgi:hypothetical protein